MTVARHLLITPVNNMNAPEYSQSIPVIQLDANARGKFIARTYNHLFTAIVAFTLIEVALFKLEIAKSMAEVMGKSWLLVLGGFVVVSWLARAAAHRAESKTAQYAALAGYVAAQAIIFVPLLYVADAYAPGAISSAAAITLAAFTGLTLIAFWTRKDFSFLRGVLMWGGIVALALIVGGIVFGFQLGTYFSVAMVGMAGAAILYDTSNVIHHYPENRYVAASLELFASVALMMWYVLRILIDRR
jgi:FtsH-binding integral membrane protein